MKILVRKSLDTGEVELFVDEDWSQIKRLLTSDPKNVVIDIDQFDRHFGWDHLRNNSIVNDGNYLWRLFNNDNEMSDVLKAWHVENMFHGRVIFLNEVDPIFED